VWCQQGMVTPVRVQGHDKGLDEWAYDDEHADADGEVNQYHNLHRQRLNRLAQYHEVRNWLGTQGFHQRSLIPEDFSSSLGTDNRIDPDSSWELHVLRQVGQTLGKIFG
jgi:hypothetical protein